MPVLRGGLQSIQAFRPVIQAELRVHEASCDEAIELLADAGYRGWMLCDGQEVPTTDYKQFRSSKFGYSGHRDFLFEPTAGAAARR